MELVLLVLLLIAAVLIVDLRVRVQRLESRLAVLESAAQRARPQRRPRLARAWQRWAVVIVGTGVAAGLAPALLIPAGLPWATPQRGTIVAATVTVLIGWMAYLGGAGRANPPREFRIGALGTALAVAVVTIVAGTDHPGVTVAVAAGWVMAMLSAGPGRTLRNWATLLVAATLVVHVVSGTLHPAVWFAGAGDLPAAVVGLGAVLAASAAAGLAAAVRARSIRGKKRGLWRVAERLPDHTLAAFAIVAASVMAATAMQATGGTLPRVDDALRTAPFAVVWVFAAAALGAAVMLGVIGRRHRRPDLALLAAALCPLTVGVLLASGTRSTVWLVVWAAAFALAAVRLGWGRSVARRVRRPARLAAIVCAGIAVGAAGVFAPPTAWSDGMSARARGLGSLAALMVALGGLLAYARRARPVRTWRPWRRPLLVAMAAVGAYGLVHVLVTLSG